MRLRRLLIVSLSSTLVLLASLWALQCSGALSMREYRLSAKVSFCVDERGIWISELTSPADWPQEYGPTAGNAAISFDSGIISIVESKYPYPSLLGDNGPRERFFEIGSGEGCLGLLLCEIRINDAQSPPTRKSVAWILRMPYAWGLSVNLIIVVAIVPWRSLRARNGGLKCQICGYDLRATPLRCPECGHTREEKRE